MSEILKLTADVFKKTRYIDCGNCAISKAAMKHFNLPEANEGTNILYLHDKGHTINLCFRHAMYDDVAFDEDQRKAAEADWSEDVVIREITLTQVI